MKAKGNEAYQARNYPHAAEYYTRAIAMTPRPEPVFYSNRAACTSPSVSVGYDYTNIVRGGYINMKPPKYEQVVADCDEALKLDATYVKAMNRRAGALENLERYKEALRGASCHLS